MKQQKQIHLNNRAMTLRENQAILVLDKNGKFQCLYALRQDKVYRITKKGKNQRTDIIYIENLADLLKVS